jgi:hypothetical protein
MGRFTKRMVLGLAAALAVAGGAFAGSPVLDDFEGGTNANKFGSYWYFYTNTYVSRPAANPTGCNNKDFTSALVDAKLEMIDNAEKSGTATLLFKGSYGSNLEIPAHGGDFSGVMKFSNLLSPWKSKTTLGSPDVYPGVGMGTGLTQDSINGMGAGFASATAIKFWMKASDADLVVKFKIEFATQRAGNGNSWACNADASYEIILAEPTTVWKQYTVNITPANAASGAACSAPKLCRPTWETEKPYTYDLSKASKVAWFIEGAGSGTAEGASGWIAVDDIEFVGYTFEDKWLCESCIANPGPQPKDSLLFSNFDNQLPGTQSLGQNRLKQYWYAYTDSIARGTQGTPTRIVQGQYNDPYYPDGPSLLINDESNVYGYGGTHGAFIQFEMGDAFTKNGETITPFVGIGTNLADSGEVYNGSQLTKVWLRYKTTEFEELYVEFHDQYASTHDDGEVFYTKLPGTEGAWVVAEIPVNGTVLRLPSWASKRTGPNATFDKTKLTKIQFKNQSSKSGTLILDDIFFDDPTIAGEVLGPVSVKHLGSKAKVSGLRAVYSHGKIGVNWNAGTSVASGSVQLVNTKGRVVASAPIASAAGKVTANLGASTIPTGMYFVRVNAKDVNGKKIVSQAPISVVK